MNDDSKMRLLNRIIETGEAISLSCGKSDKHKNLKLRVLRHIIQYHNDEIDSVLEYLHQIDADMRADIQKGIDSAVMNDDDFEKFSALVAAHAVVGEMIESVRLMQEDTRENAV
jgi:hypothetical protein